MAIELPSQRDRQAVEEFQRQVEQALGKQVLGLLEQCEKALGSLSGE